MNPALIPLITAGVTGLFSAASAERQMRFQERMSSTAVTRQMRDMRRAGVNPQLAGRMGGASTPSGESGEFSDPGPNIVSARVAKEQEQLIRSQEHMIRTQQRRMEQIYPFERDEILARTATSAAQARSLEADTLLKTLAVPGARNQARMQSTLFGRALPFITSARSILRR